MEDLSIQLKNIKLQLKTLEKNFGDIITQFSNFTESKNISSLLQSFGIEILNMGIKIFNIGIDLPYFDNQENKMYNLYYQIQNIDMQIHIIGNKINMKNNAMFNPISNMVFQNPNMMMNNMMNNNILGNMNNMQNDYNEEKWNLKFEENDNLKITTVYISPDKTFQEAINVYKFKSGNISKEYKFIFNGHLIYPEQKIRITGLTEGSKISVIRMNAVLGG